jgi:single-stranded-DNA-specific exonuclease
VRYRWRFPSEKTDTLEDVRRLSEAINVPETIASILVDRGIRTFEEARDYFRPSLDQLFDPHLLDDMNRAVARIRTAIDAKERITIYGDYDVDGTTSTAMLTMFLESIGACVTYHIPDRFTEGYGLSVAGLDRCILAPEGPPGLIISIDCGITAIDAVAYALSRGVEIIICDHHEPTDTLPVAYAIINPIKPGCSYPNKHLCGCGVGLKLIQALSGEFGETERYKEYLDFVALASSADIVSLKGENRILTSAGLKLLNDNPRPGLKALINAAHLKEGKLGTNQVVFGLAPRINAAGRLGDGGRAVRLMMSKSDQEAAEAATELELVNSDRRKIDEEAFFEACYMVDEVLNRVEDKIIVLHHSEWHAGVIGIVASRLVERYHLPVVLLTTIDGVAKGSARSITGFDIHSALKRCEDKLLTFGGHKYAAGVSIDTTRVPEFRFAINKVAREMISEEMLVPEIEISSIIDLNDLTPKFFAIIRQFAPYGPDNTRPFFYSKNVEVVGMPRTVGKVTTHLKFQVRSATPLVYNHNLNGKGRVANTVPFTLGGGTVEAIGFGLGERIKELLDTTGKLRHNVEMIYALEENEYNGRITPQLVVRDFR